MKVSFFVDRSNKWEAKYLEDISEYLGAYFEISIVDDKKALKNSVSGSTAFFTNTRNFYIVEQVSKLYFSKIFMLVTNAKARVVRQGVRFIIDCPTLKGAFGGNELLLVPGLSSNKYVVDMAVKPRFVYVTSDNLLLLPTLAKMLPNHRFLNLGKPLHMSNIRNEEGGDIIDFYRSIRFLVRDGGKAIDPEEMILAANGIPTVKLDFSVYNDVLGISNTMDFSRGIIKNVVSMISEEWHKYSSDICKVNAEGLFLTHLQGLSRLKAIITDKIYQDGN